MSSSDRRQFLLLSLAALGGCGFTPVYAPNGGGTKLDGAIALAPPDDKNGFDLTGRLADRLGRATAPRYDLAYTITTESLGVGVTVANEIQRYQLTGKVDWSLTERATGARVAGGTAENFTAYSATSSTIAGLTAKSDAAKRLMTILADQIVAQILAKSGSLA